MAFQRYEFNEVERAEAEAIGVPGQRRFRMIFGNGLDTVVLWLEKQQLQALGLAFEQMIAQLRTANVEQARFPKIVAGPVGPVPGSAATAGSFRGIHFKGFPCSSEIGSSHSPSH